MRVKFPIQPIQDNRFVENKIVTYLLDNGGIDLNQLARLDFPDADREQFSMLIGYSVSCAVDMSKETREAAELMADSGVDEEAARVTVLRKRLMSVRALMRDGVSELYDIHPDDLAEE